MSENKEKVVSRDLVGYLIISLKTNNLLENKDIIELILCKKEKVKTVKTVDNSEFESTHISYKIVVLRVNKCVDLGHYRALLKENDFNDNDFKPISTRDLKDFLLEKNDNIIKVLHNNCKENVKYIKEIRGI